MLSKMEKRKRWGGGEKSSLESTSAASGGGLWALESGVWGVGGDGGGGSCMFGSIQSVHVVNMKAVCCWFFFVFFKLGESRLGGEACF